MFQFPVFGDLHNLGCPEQDLTILKKCLSVCLRQKFSDKHSSKTKAQNFMKL